MAKILGRKNEIAELNNIYESGKPEFVVVYGRRRVGKTFLIREMFKDKLSFYHTALSPIELGDNQLLKKQLLGFGSSLSKYGLNIDKMPSNWFDAFDMLISLLEMDKTGQRQVVFIDELPWMDTSRSGFITAFEHFWNGWGAGRDNLMLIVCGSATSWITDNLINNHGGLYNRTTREIKIKPFTLHECEEYYSSNGIQLDRISQMEAYMITGGIPYYMSYIEKGKSIAQNIDSLMFRNGAKLSMEFDRLFSSLFTNAEEYKKVVVLLSEKKEGYSRKEIAEQTGIPYGGGLSIILQALEASDFILHYTYYKHNKRDVRYKLIDHFCLFHCHFKIKKTTNNDSFWQDNYISPMLNTWRGFAFEQLCFSHTSQIRKALGISGVQTEAAPWRSNNTEGNNAQIDMILLRSDRVINLCEMKYSSAEYSIDKEYDTKLRQKIDVFARETKSKSSLQLTLITTFGLAYNMYSGLIQRTVTMNDLFCE